MGKTIRPAYPAELSIGLLLLIFCISLFLSHQIFDTHHMPDGVNVYFGMFLVSCAVLVMTLVLWEEFLFPVKVKHVEDRYVFRNHRAKLMTQLFIYLAIPAIFAFIYLEYEVNHVRFWVWAGVCTLLPLAGKLISGINNYNDFLALTNDWIEYKNNRKVGVYPVKDIKEITLVRDQRTVLHKIQLLFKDGKEVVIDLDEMELDEFLTSIDKHMITQYKGIIRGSEISTPPAAK